MKQNTQAVRVGIGGTQDVSRPTIGQTMIVYGRVCTITKIRPFGTVDVIAPHGQAYRVSGLAFI